MTEQTFIYASVDSSGGESVVSSRQERHKAGGDAGAQASPRGCEARGGLCIWESLHVPDDSEPYARALERLVQEHPGCSLCPWRGRTTTGPADGAWNTVPGAGIRSPRYRFARQGDRADWVDGHDGPANLHQAHTALANAEAEKQQFAFLARASTLLASSLDLPETVATVADLAVPLLGDWCLIHVVHEDPALTITRGAYRPPVPPSLQQCLEHCFPFASDVPFGIAEAMRTGRPSCQVEVTEAHLAAATRDPDHRRAMEALGMSSTLCVPFVSAGRILGFLLLVAAHPARAFGPRESALAEDFAHCAALNLENAQRYRGTQRALRAREAQLKVMSHELRNPLHTVLLAADRLLAVEELGSSDTQIRHRAQVIQRAARQMERQICDMLDLESMTSGQLLLRRSPCEVKHLLQEALEGLAPLAEEKSIRLNWEASHTDGELLCDRARLLQVFSNILGNAIFFTPTGGVIRVRAESTVDGLHVSVSDSGPGIPPDHLPHIFEPYWQGQPGHHHGSGLGLTICRAIVEAHGGHISVESRQGAGCTFWFTLPIHRLEPTPVPSHEPSNRFERG